MGRAGGILVKTWVELCDLGHVMVFPGHWRLFGHQRTWISWVSTSLGSEESSENLVKGQIASPQNLPRHKALSLSYNFKQKVQVSKSCRGPQDK
jgi:hypothetical protein